MNQEQITSTEQMIATMCMMLLLITILRQSQLDVNHCTLNNTRAHAHYIYMLPKSAIQLQVGQRGKRTFSTPPLLRSVAK